MYDNKEHSELKSFQTLDKRNERVQQFVVSQLSATKQHLLSTHQKIMMINMKDEGKNNT